MINTRGATIVGALTTGLLALCLWLGSASSGMAGTPASHKADSPYATAVLPIGTANKFVGNRACIKLVHDKRLPPLVRSHTAPSAALVSELALLRDGSTPVDSTSLGSWDRYPDLISKIFTRYARVFNGPHHVKIAFVPVTYCNQTILGSLTNGNTTARETLQQAMMMLVLSNPGEHAPVIVGDAQQIHTGPGLAGLDIAHNGGWIQSTVVPDGVSRVVMHFPAAAGPNATEAVAIHDNVGIVVRGHPYGPTTVQWFGPTGKLLKTFTAAPGQFD